ncbi:hypothetical protein C0Q70_17565 [Pomacea canaliculata]|uniref:Uncharacterized protein n=1 Tax=Pomacea canaliculata TaxID=400727 RepID=A0A2T7NKR4_POMCA|nr:hypothetical protein C0Q70_17565 [Pomacea canaliculata]
MRMSLLHIVAGSIKPKTPTAVDTVEEDDCTGMLEGAPRFKGGTKALRCVDTGSVSSRGVKFYTSGSSIGAPAVGPSWKRQAEAGWRTCCNSPKLED